MLFLFEAKRLVFSIKTQIIAVTLIVFSVGLFLFLSYNSEPIERSYKDKSDTASTQISLYKSYLEVSPTDEKIIEKLDFWRGQQQLYSQANFYAQSKDEDVWKKEFSKVIQANTNALSAMENGLVQEGFFSVNDLTNEIYMLEYHLENDIQASEHTYKSDVYSFLLSFLDILLPTIIQICVILLLFDIFTREYEDGSYKLLFIQPFSRSKILLSKLMAGYSVVLAIFLIAITIGALVAFVFEGMGEALYPIAVKKPDDITGFYIPMAINKVLLQLIIPVILNLSFITVITCIASLLFKSSNSCLSALMILFFGYYLTTSTNQSTKPSLLSSVDIVETIKHLNIETGILITFVATFVLIISGLIYINKKDL